MTVFFIQLNTGTELISEVYTTQEKPDVYVLHNPFRIISFMDGGALMPTLHPFIYGKYLGNIPVAISSVSIMDNAGNYMTALYEHYKNTLLSTNISQKRQVYH